MCRLFFLIVNFWNYNISLCDNLILKFCILLLEIFKLNLNLNFPCSQYFFVTKYNLHYIIFIFYSHALVQGGISATLCRSSDLTGPLISDGNSMEIYFTTDNSVNRTGFSLDYKAGPRRYVFRNLNYMYKFIYIYIYINIFI